MRIEFILLSITVLVIYFLVRKKKKSSPKEIEKLEEPENDSISFKIIFKELVNSIGLKRGLLITIIHLIKKPESVINYYIENVVKFSSLKPKYLSPLSLLIFISAIIALVSFFSGENFMIESFNSVSNSTSSNEDDILIDQYEYLLYGDNMVFGQLILGILPITILSKLFFKKHIKYNLASHFVITSYVMTLLLIVESSMNFFSFLFKNEELDTFLLIIYFIVNIFYYAFAIKRLFKVSILSAVFKVFLILFFNLIMMSLAIEIL